MLQNFKLSFLHNTQEINLVDEFEFRNKPFANSALFLAPIQKYELLTRGADVKRVYSLELCLKNISFNFLPGDTIAILPHNSFPEVNKLLDRLKVLSDAEKFYKLEVLNNTERKNATLPKHIPRVGILKDIFTKYVDIRRPPKKIFLKALIQYTAEAEEIKRLEELCKPSGSKIYSDLINGNGRTLLGLLNIFPSCCPPVEIILQHSFPLQPRFFSISSSPLETNLLRITFFVVENEDNTKGVCTGWLENIITNSKIEGYKIPFYFRQPNNFGLTTNLTVPIVMIATGTGLAPFKGFLDHRALSVKNKEYNIGDAYLFYGCRYPDRDFLFKREIKEYLSKGSLTKLYTAFSREQEKKNYIQDRINEHSEEFINCLFREEAIVYICGDITSTVQAVRDTIVNILIKHCKYEFRIAEETLKKLVEDGRIIIDTWT